MQEYKKIGIIVADDEEFKPLADLVTRGEFSESYFLKRKILNFKLYSIFLHSVMKSEYDEHSEAWKFK